jgi:hypothetical protein
MGSMGVLQVRRRGCFVHFFGFKWWRKANCRGLVLFGSTVGGFGGHVAVVWQRNRFYAAMDHSTNCPGSEKFRGTLFEALLFIATLFKCSADGLFNGFDGRCPGEEAGLSCISSVKCWRLAHGHDEAVIADLCWSESSQTKFGL